ncbi:MAG: DUF2950 domain-containing protein [Rhodospirillales bacterium]|nr:DUF2950 domain-containing protein [Rhodospirillales bacterium]
MSGSLLRRGLLALALVAGLAVTAAAQPKLQGFPTADAAATALVEAVRTKNIKAMAAMLGAGWAEFMVADAGERDRRRAAFLAAWDENHKVTISDGTKATVEAGKSGWTLPIPIVKDGAEWRFDVEAGRQEMRARLIGRDELAVIQTMLAIVDAQRDYAALDPLKTGAPAYARRLLSSPGKKDGLYWDVPAGQPASPLGPAVAKAQAGSGTADGHYGYNFRLLYAQGSAAPGGARDYIVAGRMIGGFAAIAWPVRYGETGVMTFIVSQSGDVYQRDLGPETAQRAAAIVTFNPDKDWTKADMTPP